MTNSRSRREIILISLLLSSSKIPGLHNVKNSLVQSFLTRIRMVIFILMMKISIVNMKRSR
jgi:hypothetical protein